MAEIGRKKELNKAFFGSSKDITIPQKPMDQVIGQDLAVRVAKLACAQKRSLLLIGPPGVGKSMIARSMAPLLARDQDHQVYIQANPEIVTNPLVLVTDKEPLPEENDTKASKDWEFIVKLAMGALCISGIYMGLRHETILWYIITVLGFTLLALLLKKIRTVKTESPLICLIPSTQQAPFIDATGLKAGALFGDIKHDPWQTGDKSTPPHKLIVPGAIHRAHGGILFIDEISSLSLKDQQFLLTVIQEKQSPITGRNPGSSGTMVCTDPIPCDFMLVIAGNEEDMEQIHPALRSRIQGAGYEVLMNSTMEKSIASKNLLQQFISQEVAKDGRIPDFSNEGMAEILKEAEKRSVTGQYTLKLRELGGLIRCAGDLTREKEAKMVSAEEVLQALTLKLSIEEQLAQTNQNDISVESENLLCPQTAQEHDQSHPSSFPLS